MPVPPNYNPCVIDIARYQPNPDLAKARDESGILGVISKATQGTSYVDPMFAAHRAATKAAGLLVGHYHFGTNADGKKQADHFLRAVGVDSNTLYVLDYEDDPRGGDMTVEQAHVFVQTVRNETGRWPVFYSGYYWLLERLGNRPDPLLGACPFWLAGYTKAPKVPPTWKDWDLWQYTEGVHGFDPHLTAGVGRCDRNFFKGDAAALRQFWMNAGR